MQTIDIQVNTKGARLKHLRETLGLGQGEFAERWGTDQSNASKMEKDLRPIGKRLSRDLLQEFQVNPIWWETGEGEMFANGTVISNSNNRNISIKSHKSIQEVGDVGTYNQAEFDDRQLLLDKLEALQKTIEAKDEIIKTKDDFLKAKDEIIELLKKLNDK